MTTESVSIQQYEDLFHSLIFSGDTRADVARQLEQCTDSKFAEYLQTTLDQSQDEDEKEGLQELMDMIAQVVVEEKELKEQQKMEELNSKDEAAKAERQAELEKEANENKVAASISSAAQSSMSNVDVLKQANAIDEAVMTNVMSDDEKPSDFISDCREVVNLSRGFNNKGRMRVGGRNSGILAVVI
ncbi:unnamed protein product [Cylindrotheca closterium]|uniref:Uncharacterized protein n=1 Tax=Cylindrotheca closterium TaxID=2856 RepID=A0AAD2FFA4_9STRA|nr:unnamed protein product [Cylindrotheca closterium]